MCSPSGLGSSPSLLPLFSRHGLGDRGSPDLISKTNTLELSLLPVSPEQQGQAGALPTPRDGWMELGVKKFPPQNLWVGFYGMGAVEIPRGLMDAENEHENTKSGSEREEPGGLSQKVTNPWPFLLRQQGKPGGGGLGVPWLCSRSLW